MSLAGIFHPANRPEPDSLAIQQIDSTNPTIYALLQRLVEDIMTPPLQLVQPSTKEGAKPGDFDVVEDHPALFPVLKSPNEVETPRIFWQQIAADLIWMGNGYVWTNSPDGITPPTTFLRLHPSQVTPTPPKEPNGRILSHYEWRNDNNQQRYEPEKILHFRTRNPDGLYRGQGIGVRLRDWLNLEYQAMQWQYRRYYNDIPVDLIVKTTQKIGDPDQRRRVEEFFDNRLSGRKNGGRRWVMLDDALWDIKDLPRANEKDLQYLETLKFIRATYAMTCGVPPSKLADYSDSFRANAETQKEDYWYDQVMVWHALLLDVLNMKYLARFYPGEEIRFQFDYTKVRALSENETEKTAAAKERVGSLIATPNEAREALGLERYEDEAADKLYWNGREMGAPEPAPVAPGAVDPDSEDPEGDAANPKPKPRPKLLAIKTTSAEDDERPASSSGIDSVDDLLPKSERDRLRAKVQRDIAAIVRDAGNRQLDLAGLAGSFNTADPAVAHFIAKQTIGLVEAVSETTEELVRLAIAESYADGVPVREMREKIQEAYAVRREDWQLDRVARTETHQAQEGGSHLAAAQAGLEAKRWITARDYKVRGLADEDQADHAGMEGQVVPMGSAFTDPRSGARLQFPGDRDGAKSGADTINCRCTWVADFSHLKSIEVEFANIEHAWEAKSADRSRWETGLKRRFKSFLLEQERRVLARFDEAVREHAARRGGVGVAGN